VKSVPVLPRLHAITDERIARRPDLSTVAQQLAAGGGENLVFHARSTSSWPAASAPMRLRVSS